MILKWVPIYTETLFRAAEIWAELRKRGLATAADKALDGDVILAAQAHLLHPHEETRIVIATTNVGHLSRMAHAALWTEIAS